MRHDEIKPAIVMNFKLSLEDRRLLREYSHRHEITMSDAVRLGIRRVCGSVDQKPVTAA
jgi:hypothetical protein